VTADTPVSPLTVTGEVRLLVVPSPSCPKALAPQDRTVPSPSTARPWSRPQPTAVTPRRFRTGTGLVRRVRVPSPSWPRLLRPQDLTVPSASSPTLW
jgi:hypothetical protein